MNFSETLDNNTEDLKLSGAAINYLQKTAKWGKFISKIGFLFIGLMIFSSFGISALLASINAKLGFKVIPFSPILFFLFFNAISVALFFPFKYIYRFASSVQFAIAKNDSLAITDSLKNLKSLFKFYGIFLGIMVVLIVVILGLSIIN